jgi:hypothetical protein
MCVNGTTYQLIKIKMNTKKILVVSGANDNLLEWANDSEDFEYLFAHTDERAIEISHQQLFDMVVVDNTDGSNDFRKLFAVLPILQSEIIVLGYNGEPVSELEGKVKHAFNKRKAERIKRLLILDSSGSKTWNNLIPFSAN